MSPYCEIGDEIPNQIQQVWAMVIHDSKPDRQSTAFGQGLLGNIAWYARYLRLTLVPNILADPKSICQVSDMEF